jgi:hypothetical protein
MDDFGNAVHLSGAELTLKHCLYGGASFDRILGDLMVHGILVVKFRKASSIGRIKPLNPLLDYFAWGHVLLHVGKVYPY